MAIVAFLAVVLALLFAGLWLRRGRRVRELERERGELREALSDAGEARETFFALVTHELRSPLSAILGYQELLADGAYGEFGDELTEPVDRIGRSARHLLHLIDGVVELSRLRTGTVRLDVQPVNLDVVMASVADSFRTYARERGVRPHVSVADRLPTVRSDQDRLLRALDLLLTSAVKHPAGEEISLRVSRDDGGATAEIGETEIEIRERSDDPALRLGIRLAVAEGIARALGGGLELEVDEDGPIRRLAFRIRDSEQASGSF